MPRWREQEDQRQGGADGTRECLGLEEWRTGLGWRTRGISGRGAGSEGGGAGGPFELVGVPMLCGEGACSFVPIGNRLATGLACDAPGLEILRRGGDVVIRAIGLLRCLAFEGQPGKGVRTVGNEGGARTSGAEKERLWWKGGYGWVRRKA